MKPTVDLTSDRAFGVNGTFVFNTVTINFGKHKKRHIFEKLFNQINRSPYECKDFWLKYRGKAGQYVANITNAISSEHCDRCGKFNRRIPWSEHARLCRTCNKELNLQIYGRIPWRDNMHGWQWHSTSRSKIPFESWF